MSTKKNPSSSNKSVALNNKLKKRAILSLIGSIILLLLALGLLINVVLRVKKNYTTLTPKIQVITSPSQEDDTIIVKPKSYTSIAQTKQARASSNKLIKVNNPVAPSKNINSTSVTTNTTHTLIKVKENNNNLATIIRHATIYKLAIKPTPRQILNNTKVPSYILVYANIADLDVAKQLQSKLKSHKINAVIVKKEDMYELQSSNMYLEPEARKILTKYKEQYSHD